MNGSGVPLVMPFDADGDVDHVRLCDLVSWLEQRGVDFLVPCGSTSEAELLTATERAAVVETVAEMYETHRTDPERARKLNADIVELNSMLTGGHPGNQMGHTVPGRAG